MRVPARLDHEGVVVLAQGGTEIVRGKLDALNAAGIPLAGLWIQDWPGVRLTSAGKQLWWDWKLDETFYPGWRQLVADLEAQVRACSSTSYPFLSIEEGHDTLFAEAERLGYLVERADGTPYLIKEHQLLRRIGRSQQSAGARLDQGRASRPR